MAALAIGQTLIILTAGIDLSVGAVMVLALMVMAERPPRTGAARACALIIGLVVGRCAGGLNGFLVTRLSLPPFIVTLGTLNIFTALALLYSGGADASRTPDCPTSSRGPARRSPSARSGSPIGVLLDARPVRIVVRAHPQDRLGPARLRRR